jgi:hypothetical protein
VDRITQRLDREETPIYGRRLTAEERDAHRAERSTEGYPLTQEEEKALAGLGRWASAKVKGKASGKPLRRWVPAQWVKAYVYLILSSPAAMGSYQPRRQDGKRVVPDGEPIAGFFPEVVSEDVWHAAQSAIRSRAGDFGENGQFRKGGTASRAAGRKSDEEVNLFSGLIHDAISGQKMHIVYSLGRPDKKTGERKKYVYLCPSQETGTHSGGLRVDYLDFERAILSRMKELRPSDVIADEKHANGRETEIARLSGRLLDIDSRLERAQQRARTTEDFDAFLDLIQGLQGERKEVSERLAELRHEEADRPSADLGEAQGLIALLELTPAEQRPELRQRLRTRIRQLVDAVWLVVVKRGAVRLCDAQIFFASGTVRDFVISSYRPARGNGHTRRLDVASFAAVPSGDRLDLRRREDARLMKKLFTHIDLGSLGPKRGKQPRGEQPSGVPVAQIIVSERPPKPKPKPRSRKDRR